MVISFRIKNFRSFKDSVTFSMVADASKLKIQNVAEIKLSNDSCLRVLKMAMIYGANASGKSNIIRAFYSLVSYILAKPNVGDKVRMYEPFLFDQDAVNSSAEYELEFIGPENTRYNYIVIFNSNLIEYEELSYYPNGRKTTLFTRKSDSSEGSNIHIGYLGSAYNKKEIKVFNNQLLLSKFGSDEPIADLSNIYLYFKKYEVVNSVNSFQKDKFKKEVSEAILADDKLKNKLNSLLRYADIKLKGVSIQTSKNSTSSDREKYLLFGLHSIYKQGQHTGEDAQLPFNDESVGTQVLFSIGGKILLVLENGGVLVIDELDISLHPFLTRMIILMFQSEKINPNNAQLIFTSHDMTLLDRDIVRKDQVWIAEKSDNGTSEIFSLQDFEGVREETPFDKWYLAGKFGGLPSLKSIDLMFENDSTR